MPIRHDPPPPNPPDDVSAVADPLLVVDNLAFRYPDGQSALNGVSLTLRRGEKVALVGPNGAGKSTLLLHLNGILGGEQPAVRVAGLPVVRRNLPRIRALVGLVFQDPNDQLFSPTVYEDVAFGPLHMGLSEAEIRQRVAESLEQVGLSGFELRRPYHMSAGQKKRAAVATVLAMRPALLALDEPSAGLDPRGRRALIDLLRRLPLAMLVSTHDMQLVRELFPRTIVLDDGRVAADGPTEALLADAALLAAHGLEAP